MIMFWNRKEIFMGCSAESFYQIRQKLEANNIRYDYKLASNHNSFSFGSSGITGASFGENMQYSTTYYIYVHKKEFEYACAAMRSNGNY